MTTLHAPDCPGRPGWRGICNCESYDAEERIAALARELAACRLALLNCQTERDAAQQEAAALRSWRSASMAQALGTVTTTRIGMLP